MVDQGGNEVVVDRALREHALRGDAGLAGVAEAGHLDLRRRASPVAARLEDDRRVVAELEPDTLARRSRMPQPTGGDPVNVMRATSG